jgi:hypothetical protein
VRQAEDLVEGKRGYYHITVPHKLDEFDEDEVKLLVRNYPSYLPPGRDARLVKMDNVLVRKGFEDA